MAMASSVKGTSLTEAIAMILWTGAVHGIMVMASVVDTSFMAEFKAASSAAMAAACMLPCVLLLVHAERI